MSEELEALADEIGDLADRVGDLIYDALRAQNRGGDQVEAARERERQLARARRSLVKAAQVLQELSGE